MTTFAKQMNEAIATYAELSGSTFAKVAAACADLDSQTARNVSLLMFAAR